MFNKKDRQFSQSSQVHWLWVALLFFWLHEADALEKSQDLRARYALMFFDDQEYAPAEAIYSALLQEPQTLFDQMLLRYNKGVVLLAQSKWQQALDELSSLPISEDIFPLLAGRLLFNRAFARLMLVKTRNDNSEEGVFTSSALHLQDIQMMQMALNELDKAEQADCALAKYEGKLQCESASDVPYLKSLIKESLSKALQEESALHTERLSLQENAALFDDLDIEYGKTSISNILLKIGASYLAVLTSVYPSLDSLISLQQNWIALNSTWNADNNEELKTTANRSQTRLEQGIENFKKNEMKNARLYITLSYDDFKFIWKTIFHEEERSTAAIVEKAIEKQFEVFSLVLLLQPTSFEKIQSDDSRLQGVTNIQKQVIGLEPRFLRAVLNEQKQKNAEGITCHKQPWDEALPLYYQAQDYAKKAEEYLTLPDVEIPLALKAQISAISKWEQTLKKLKQYASLSESQLQQENFQKKENLNPFQSKKELKKKQEFDGILELLEEMEQDDKMPKKVGSFRPENGVRPW